MVQLNLDEYNGALMRLPSEEDQLLFLRGFSLGVNGGAPLPDSPLALLDGHEVGASARARALDYQVARDARSSKGGKVTQLRRLKEG